MGEEFADPLRHRLPFAYACFFLAVRGWIEFARREPEDQVDQPQVDLLTWGSPDAEGGFIVFVVPAVGVAVGGLFLALGGAPMLLEAAFEEVFAGVVVKPPTGTGESGIELL